MATITPPQNHTKAPKDDPSVNILGQEKPRPKIPIRIVVNKKTKNNIPENGLPLSQANLIKFVDQLAEDVKSGKAKGIGGFVVYDDDTFTFGLEGYYLVNPNDAVLPLMRLHRRIMNQIEAEE